MPARLWDRAATLPVPAGERPRAAAVALEPGLPSLGALFDFMRDAELRFETLRMRIEERTTTVAGDSVATIDLVLRHVGDAKVTTSEPAAGARTAYEIWISDGETVRTYAAAHKLGTQRPVRRRVAGLESPDLPGTAKVYRPLTALPMESLPDAFVHPAGYCQNVLATGRCRVAGSGRVAGRETVVVIAEHPRGTKVWADRPDFEIRVEADRETGAILRLVESVGGAITRDATVTSFEPNATLPPTAFDFEFPPDTTTIY